MGFALAEHLAFLGANVVLVAGPVNLKLSHPLVERIDVTSADQMYEACVRNFASCDVAIMTAAVADYKPAVEAPEKLKRSGGNLLIEMVPNRDIAAELGKRKRPGQFLVGFALETQHEIENAFSKLKKKNLDMVVLNSLRDDGSGFGFDTNKITIISRSKEICSYPLKSKGEVAADIVRRISELEQSGE